MNALTASSNGLLRPRRKRTISLTALIDVVFILLMFFMLTSSFIHRKMLEVNIPAAADGTGSAQTPRLLVLTNDGGFRFSASTTSALIQPASADEALQQIQQASDSTLPLIVLPQDQVQLQRILTVLQQLQQAGIPASLGKTLSAEAP